MDNSIKINIINDKISQLDFHIDILNNNISNGLSNKDGMPSFNTILNDMIMAKQVLNAELDKLS
jgi:hypothetical protein